MLPEDRILPEDLERLLPEDLTPLDLELRDDLIVPDDLVDAPEGELARVEVEFLIVRLGLVTLVPLLDLIPELRLTELLFDLTLLVLVTALDNLLVE